MTPGDKLFAAIRIFPWAFVKTSDIMKIQTILKEANPMTRGEALKDFFRKTILPAASAALLYCIFRSACVKNGELDYLWLWILCGLPFGIWRLAALDHTGRRLSGRRDRPVRAELRLCRPYRRLRPCLAAAGGGMVCAADAVPPADGGL